MPIIRQESFFSIQELYDMSPPLLTALLNYHKNAIYDTT